jgi:hypothetical protein
MQWWSLLALAVLFHGAGGAPRQSQVLSAGREMPAGMAPCRQEWAAIPSKSVSIFLRETEANLKMVSI